MTSPTPTLNTPTPAPTPAPGPATGPVPELLVLELSYRDRAILRAVAAGGAELLTGREPDLLLEGRCCADQAAAHRLAHAGLITTAYPARTGETVGQRLPAQLTAAGLALATGRTRS